MILSGMSESAQDTITLDIEPFLFRYILDYIYGLTIHVPSTHLISLLGVANCYCMTGLASNLAIVLGKNLSISNCCALYSAADVYQCTALKFQAKDMLFSNFAAVSKTNGFYDLGFLQMKYILSSDDILNCDEEVVFDAAVR